MKSIVFLLLSFTTVYGDGKYQPLFKILNHPSVQIRNDAKKSLINSGISIVSDIDQALKKQYLSTEQHQALVSIKNTIIYNEEIKKQKNIDKQIKLLELGKCGKIPGINEFINHFPEKRFNKHKTYKLYAYLYKIHNQELNRFFEYNDLENRQLQLDKIIRKNSYRINNWATRIIVIWLAEICNDKTRNKLTIDSSKDGCICENCGEYIFHISISSPPIFKEYIKENLK